MKINQHENGNIIIQTENNKVLYVLPYASFSVNPIRSNELFINSINSRDLSFAVKDISEINGEFINSTNTQEVLSLISERITTGGSSSLNTNQNEDPLLLRELSPAYQQYKLATDFESLLSFAIANNINQVVDKFQGGKLVEQSYYCSWDNFTLGVKLTYIYYSQNPTVIKHVIMTRAVYLGGLFFDKNIKVYNYDQDTNITGYSYVTISDI